MLLRMTFGRAPESLGNGKIAQGKDWAGLSAGSAAAGRCVMSQMPTSSAERFRYMNSDSGVWSSASQLASSDGIRDPREMTSHTVLIISTFLWPNQGSTKLKDVYFMIRRR